MGFSLIFDQQNQSHSNSPFWNWVIFGMILLNPKHGLQWCRLGKSLESFQITHILIVTILFKSRNDPAIPPCSPKAKSHLADCQIPWFFFRVKSQLLNSKEECVELLVTKTTRHAYQSSSRFCVFCWIFGKMIGYNKGTNHSMRVEWLRSFILDFCWHQPEQQWFWDTPTCPSFLVTSCRGRFEMWNVERLNQRRLTAQIYCVHSRLLLPTS